MGTAMKGVAINSKNLFFENNVPRVWDDLSWFLDSESSPYNIPKSYNNNWDDWEGFLAKSHEYLGSCSSSIMLKPSFFSQMSSSLKLDDWFYLTGVQVQNAGHLKEIADTYSEIENHTGFRMFDFINKYKGIFMIYTGSWWEVYDASMGKLFKVNEYENVVNIESERWELWKKANYNTNPNPFE